MELPVLSLGQGPIPRKMAQMGKNIFPSVFLYVWWQVSPEGAEALGYKVPSGAVTGPVVGFLLCLINAYERGVLRATFSNMKGLRILLETQ